MKIEVGKWYWVRNQGDDKVPFDADDLIVHRARCLALGEDGSGVFYSREWLEIQHCPASDAVAEIDPVLIPTPPDERPWWQRWFGPMKTRHSTTGIQG